MNTDKKPPERGSLEESVYSPQGDIQQSSSKEGSGPQNLCSSVVLLCVAAAE
jgi:hypothetical protein